MYWLACAWNTLGADPSMLIGNPCVYASPLPTPIFGANGSRAARTAWRAFSSSSRAIVISGFCFSAASTASRSFIV